MVRGLLPWWNVGVRVHGFVLFICHLECLRVVNVVGVILNKNKICENYIAPVLSRECEVSTLAIGIVPSGGALSNVDYLGALLTMHFSDEQSFMQKYGDKPLVHSPGFYQGLPW